MSTNFLAGRIEGEKNKEQYAEEKAKEQEQHAKLEIARKCLAEGMSIVITAKLTGLTEEEINNMKG